MSAVPQTLVDVRREQCRHCPLDCVPYREGKIEFENPRQRCPKGRWDCHGSCKEPAPPPAATQANNFFTAMTAAATSVVKGNSFFAEPEEIARRDAICAACPHWIASSKRCSQCGCFSASKNKLRSSTCPVGKW